MNKSSDIDRAVQVALEAIKASVGRGDKVSPYVTVRSQRAAHTIGDWCVQAELQHRRLTNYVTEGVTLYVERQPGMRPALQTEWLTSETSQAATTNSVNFGKSKAGSLAWVILSTPTGAICLAGTIHLGMGKWRLFRMRFDPETGTFVYDKTWERNRKKHDQATKNGHRSTQARRKRKKRNGRWKVNNLNRKQRKKLRDRLGVS